MEVRTMNSMESLVMKDNGTDLGNWLQCITDSIPRTIIVNVDELQLTDLQLRMESGLTIMARLMAHTIQGGNCQPISADKLNMIKSMLDPSIIAMVPHHMVKRIFNLSDAILKELRLDEYVESQEISKTYVYNWDMLRSEWMSGTLNPISE